MVEIMRSTQHKPLDNSRKLTHYFGKMLSMHTLETEEITVT